MSDNFKSVIAEVKLAYDIADYITQSGVSLKPNGTDKWKGLCPFHNEKSPSFHVSTHFANYHCFGCGAGGDIIAYVQKTENLDFFESVRKLAEDKNIAVDFDDQNQAGVDYKSLRECLKETANFFYREYKKLAPDHVARKEVVDRGLSENKMLYGYAPEGRKSLYNFLKSKNFSDETILQAGVCKKAQDRDDYYDFWVGRLMFFITDVTGKPVGFSGRKLYETDTRGKYVNSSDGPLFDKSSALFNLAKAKKKASETKTVYVNEGQFDVAALVEADATNTVASSGTAFTEKQAMILRRLVTEEGRIIFCFDGDEAGIKAVLRVFKNIPAIHSQAEVVTLPEGQDPCDYRLEHGSEALLEYLNTNSKPLIEFVLAQEKSKFTLTDDIESMKYVASCAKILKTVTNKILREKYARQVALESFISMDEVRNAIAEAKELSPEGNSKEEVVQEETPRYTEETSELSLEETLELIGTSKVYNLTARMVALALQESTLVDDLTKLLPLVPKEFAGIVEELDDLDEAVIIPEHFSEPALVSKLIQNNFFPFLHLEEKDLLAQHFNYLKKRLTSIAEEKRVKAVRREIMNKLGDTNELSADFFEKAIQFEERKLANTAPVLASEE